MSNPEGEFNFFRGTVMANPETNFWLPNINFWLSSILLLLRAILKYSHLPDHLRHHVVDFLVEQNVSVIHLIRHNQLEAFLSWEDHQ